MFVMFVVDLLWFVNELIDSFFRIFFDILDIVYVFLYYVFMCICYVGC